jgi:short-subunit dehydrogenase
MFIHWRVMTLIRDKRVLITGAGHGLGRALGRAFARAGALVLVTDRDASRVAETVAEIKSAGGRAAGHSFDVTDSEAVVAAKDKVHAEAGPIDILVNNAGIVHGGAFLGVPLAKHRATIDVNITGLLNGTHAFLPDLIARPEAHIVNVASASAVLALPFAVTYAASKWAVLGFSDSLREELRLLGHRNVRVTTICPSYITTGLFEGARPARLTWMLQPDDVAAKVLRAVERNRETVLLPWTAQLLYSTCRGLPRSWFHRVCSALGVSRSMVDWKGPSSP